MEGHLLGRFTCPPINDRFLLSNDLDVRVVASLLYFEVVHTGAVFPPLLRDQQNAHEAIDRVRRRMRNSGSSLLLNVRDLPKGVSGRDLLWVSYGSCVDQVFAVGKAYDQLQKGLCAGI